MPRVKAPVRSQPQIPRPFSNFHYAFLQIIYFYKKKVEFLTWHPLLSTLICFIFLFCFQFSASLLSRPLLYSLHQRHIFFSSFKLFLEFVFSGKISTQVSNFRLSTKAWWWGESRKNMEIDWLSNIDYISVCIYIDVCICIYIWTCE